MKIITVGAGEAYHLEPVAKSIKKYRNCFYLGVYGLWMFSDERVQNQCSESDEFDEVIPDKARIRQQSQTHKKQKNSSPLGSHEVKHKLYSFWRSELRCFLGRIKLCALSIRRRKSFFRMLEPFDLVHLQSLFIAETHLHLFTQSKKPYVVSCWGSDVLRNSDSATTFLQKAILEKASAITVTGIEFKEVILAKYGRHLEPKIVETFFNPNVEPILKVELESKLSSNTPAKWRVCLGHNGFEANNHKELLSSISKLSVKVKSKVELLIPMTYGAQPGYIDEIRIAAEEVGCAFTIYDQFMTDEEVVNLRVETDILLYAPVSDAFSGTVTQAFAAGASVIVGAWLPYKTRKMTGFEYREISKLGEAGSALREVLESWDDESEVRRSNRALCEDVFSEKNIGKGWVSAYEMALENFNG